MAERNIASRHSPATVQRELQLRHHDTVVSSSRSGSRGGGGGRCDGNHVRTLANLAPTPTVTSPVVVLPLPSMGIGVRRASPFGPAIAVSTPSRRRTHGTTWP